MWKYNNPEELYHYGVLGMKWGMRRASKKGINYTYKSHGQKKYEKKVVKLQSKPKASAKQLTKAQAKLATYKARDISRTEYARKTNLGKAVVKQALLGPIASGAYSRYRAAGYNRVVSVLGSGLPITSKIIENNAAKNRAKSN